MEKRKTVTPPKFTFVIFGAFLLLALFNIYSDLVDSRNIKPFGIFEPVMAVARDITGKSAPNSGNISYAFSSGEDIVDQLDRCLVIDPNKEDPPSKVYQNRAARRIEQNFSGANQALYIDNGYDKNAFTEYYEKSQEFGMGFTIAIARKSDGATVNAAIEYINDALTSDFTPIVRLCDSENDCDFGSSQAVIDFYNSIAAGTDGEFIAMLGPNEPGSGIKRSEMEGFGIPRGNYGALATFVNQAAEALQPLRDQGVLLSPGAANLTNQENNDVKGFIEGVNPKLFDIIMGNGYEEGDILAYDYYAKGPDLKGTYSLKEFVDTNNLQYIQTEFGIFREGSRNEARMIANAQESFELYCGDSNVAGVLFFYAIKDLSGKNAFAKIHNLDDEEIKNIIGDCERKKTRNPKVDLAWQSCNLDSCIYEDYQYPRESYAQACGVDEAEPVESLEDGAMLFIACGGGGCSAKKRNTVEVGLPIKQFGSNSSSGTRYNAYVPICAELAELFSGDPVYDPLNQFAANLDSNTGPDYPMPWLGSALNCATNLIKATGEFADDYYEEANNHPGSRLDQTYEEFKLDLESNIYSEGVSSLGIVDPDKILDERSLCIGGEEKCLDKNNNTDFIKDLRDFVPTQVPQRYDLPENNSCRAEDVIVEQDDSNYVFGPELYLGGEETLWSGPSGQVCVWHAKRNTASANENYYADEDASNISCEVNAQGTLKRNINGQTVEIPCTSLPEVPGLINNLQEGEYILDDGYGTCFNYNQSQDDRIYYYDDEYPEIPEYDIPGVYDALYNMYLRAQERLEAQNLKLVVKDNIGWEMLVRTKVRDTNRGYDTNLVGNYDYGQELDSCSVSENLFQNEYLMAKQNPIQEQSVYFEYLGYLDILQEIVNIYGSQTTFEGSEFIANPLLSEYSREDLPAELQKDVLVESGRANFLMTFPVPTCDDIEKLKFLSAQNNRQPGDDDYFAPDFETTCLAATTDGAYSDDLGNFLCDEGYDIPGLCAANPGEFGECRYIPDDENIDEEILDEDFRLIPPTRSGKISGRYGGAQYGNANAVHTGMDFGDFEGNDVLASAAGTVVYVGIDNENTSGAYGQMIKIQHPNGYVTLYAHNSQLLVAEGQTVQQGDVIARVGSTGNSSGPHVHLELRKNNSCSWDGNNPGACSIDPEPLMIGAVGGEQGQDPTDRGGKLICDDPSDRVSDREFNGLNCMLKEVAEYISSEQYDGIPPEMLRATIEVETGAQTEPGNPEEPTGDPSQITYSYENGATAMGSFQFTRSAWMDSPYLNIINRYREEMKGCVGNLGLNVSDFTYDDRAVIGIAACAAALKHIDDVKSDPAYDGLGEYVPAEQWTEETARVAAFNYYGACEWTIGNFSGNYCDDIAGIFNKYKESRVFDNLDCTNTGSSSGDDSSDNNNISAPN